MNCELFTSPLLILLISSSFCFSILLSSQGQTRRHVSEFTSLFNLRHSATDLKSKFFSFFIDRFSFHNFHSVPSTQGYWKVQIYPSKTRYLTWFKYETQRRHISLNLYLKREYFVQLCFLHLSSEPDTMRSEFGTNTAEVTVSCRAKKHLLGTKSWREISKLLFT